MYEEILSKEDRPYSCAKKECSETVPPFVTVEPGHQVLCWLAEEQQSETKHEEK